MLIDTHVHTCHSDGLSTPAEVVRAAASAGVGLLSITDHDCVGAYPEALGLAGRAGVGLIPGVEITTKNDEGCHCVHVVGLGIGTGAGVRGVLKRYADARDAADRGFLGNLNARMARAYPGWEPVADIKPSVFQNTMKVARKLHIGMTEKALMDIFLDESLWVPIDVEITLDDAIAHVKEWGGIPVLAHPWDFGNDAGAVLRRFVAAGGEAVELCKYRYKVRSGTLSGLTPGERLRREREMNAWTAAAARSHGLRMTLASDRHDGRRAMGMDPEEYGVDVSWLWEMAKRTCG